MKLSDEQIKEIAELLECGMICYIHKQTLAIEYHPDFDQLHLDQEDWEDTVNKIESDRKDYDCITRMESKHSFQIMTSFAQTITPLEFRDTVLDTLNSKKPFQNFRGLIVNSDYKKAWFTHKTQAYMNWIKLQLELID